MQGLPPARAINLQSATDIKGITQEFVRYKAEDFVCLSVMFARIYHLLGFFGPTN